MATARKRKLSASVDGCGITVAASGSTGTLIHTAVAGTTAGTYDEVWMWAYNSHSASVTLTIENGGVSANQQISVIIPPYSGLITVIPGFILQNGLTIGAFASVPNVIHITGFVNTITD